MLCEDARLLVTRLDQAKGVVMKLAALTQCVDMRAGRHQVQIDPNTPVTDEAGVSGQSLVRCNTGGNNHRSEEHTSELQSRPHLVCRLLLEKKKKKQKQHT